MKSIFPDPTHKTIKQITVNQTQLHFPIHESLAHNICALTPGKSQFMEAAIFFEHQKCPIQPFNKVPKHQTNLRVKTYKG